MTKKLNYKFNDEKLLALALTQSGANATNNNERLEFLGDRVLGLAVAGLLYEMFPAETEGELARRHSALVSADTLAQVAAEYGLDKRVRHGHMTANNMRHVMADAMESVLGAIYLDGGFDAVRQIVVKIWTPIARAALTAPKDPKTALQEFVQRADCGALPEYTFLESSGGPAHSPMFEVSVSALGKTATGRGASKKAATANAAEEMLKIISD